MKWEDFLCHIIEFPLGIIRNGGNNPEVENKNYSIHIEPDDLYPTTSRVTVSFVLLATDDRDHGSDD